MVRRLSTAALRVAAAATSLLSLVGAPATASAADPDAGLAIPRMADLLNDQSVKLAGCNCPQRCNTCPTYSGSGAAGDGSTQPGMDPSGQGASGQGASGEGLDPNGAGLEPQASSGLGGSTWAVNDAPGGYIDNPIVGNWFRLRYDDAFNDPRPDRAEFFYAKYGTAGGPGPKGANNVSPNHVNYQSILPYFEVKLAPRLSVFTELAVEQVSIVSENVAGNPGAGFNTIRNTGFADMNAGFKWAMYVDPDRYLTFQLKTYIPTGPAQLGLGTNHVSIEPGFLYLSRLTDRAYFQGELRDWIPVNGTNYAGNVMRYGGGVGYTLFQTYDGPNQLLNPYVSRGTRVIGVTEFVGWTVLNGQSTVPDQAGAGGGVISNSAKGDTIVNIKLGVRITHNQGSLYAGWGHALTDDAWYRDLFRLEYRRNF